MLPSLDIDTDLYEYARVAFGTNKASRLRLFQIRAVVDEFSALPDGTQQVLWEQLKYSTNGAQVSLLPTKTLDELFFQLARCPHTFDFHVVSHTFGTFCQESWLRHQMTAMFESCKARQRAPASEFYAYEPTSPSADSQGLRRRRTRLQHDTLSHVWVMEMTKKLIGELPLGMYSAWLGPVGSPARYPLVMAYEKGAQDGTIAVTRHNRGLFVHHVSMAMIPAPRRERAKPTKARRENTRAYKRAMQQEAQDRRETNWGADRALLNMGGTFAQLRDSVAVRLGFRPSVAALCLYLIPRRDQLPAQIYKEAEAYYKVKGNGIEGSIAAELAIGWAGAPMVDEMVAKLARTPYTYPLKQLPPT